MNDLGIAGWLYSGPILREKSMTLLELPHRVRALGFEVLELCSVFFEHQTAAYLADVRRAIDAAGLRIPSIAVDGPDISLADDVLRGVHLDTAKQWIHVAHAVGSSAIRVNTGGEVEASTSDLARIADGYRTLASLGEQEGVRVLIENHGGASYKPGNIRHLVDAVASPWFGTCPDTGNYPDGTWEEGMNVMAPHAVTTHIKVSSYSDDGWQPMQGRDGVDRSGNLRTMLVMLRDAGYTGPLCVEMGVDGDDLDASATGAAEYVRRLVTTL